MKTYPLEIVATHTDCERIYMSKGHHPESEFIKALSVYGVDTNNFTKPTYEFVKKTPASKSSGYDYWHHFVKEGTRGSYPATYVWEKY